MSSQSDQQQSVINLLASFAERLNTSDQGRAFARAFDTTIQFRWTNEVSDPTDMTWYGGTDGSWACLETRDGEVSVVEGDLRSDRDWRFCPMVETDETTLRKVLTGALRPLDAFLEERLHVSHFAVGGTSGQWVIALLAFGARPAGPGGLLPGRAEKSFMKYPYHKYSEARRLKLLQAVAR